MRARRPARARAVVGCACAALAIAGCGSSTTGGNSTVTVDGNTLVVYTSQPPGAPDQQTTDLLDAEKLAFQHAGTKVGRFSVRLVALHGRELSDNGRAALENNSQHGIAYLGELQPGTSQVSVEILNQQGMLEVSPADTAIYLTQAIPPVSNSTNTFYPGRSTYHETFARVVPNSAAEAKAIVSQMQAEHVSSVYVASDGQLYGDALALEVRQDAKAAGLTVTPGASGADGVFYGGSADSPSSTSAATHALDQAAAASPNAKLFVPSGLWDDSFASGLSSAAQQHLVVSSPGFLRKDLPPAGRTFVSQFKSAYGHSPAPQAIFGYEAMSELMYVLGKAGSQANNRATVVQDFRQLKNPPNSVIGTYSISGGDPNIAPFIFGRFRGGGLVPVKFVQSSA